MLKITFCIEEGAMDGYDVTPADGGFGGKKALFSVFRR